MIKTIFFDVDGTLYDETHAKIKAELQVANFVAQQLEKEFDEGYRQYLLAKRFVLGCSKEDPSGLNRENWYACMLEYLNTDKIQASLLCRKYWDVVIQNIEPYYDLLCILPVLSQKYDLYALTDELLEIQERKLKQLGLTNYFKSTISSTHVGVLKPNSELFHYALKYAGAKPEHSIMVGDNPAKDIRGGNLVGMFTAWVRRGKYFYYPLSEDDKADIEINHYTNFQEQLEKL